MKPCQDILQVLDQAIVSFRPKEALEADHGGVRSGKKSEDPLLSSCTVLISLRHADDPSASYGRSSSCGKIRTHLDKGHRRRKVVAYVDPDPFGSRASAGGPWAWIVLPRSIPGKTFPLAGPLLKSIGQGSGQLNQFRWKVS